MDFIGKNIIVVRVYIEDTARQIILKQLCYGEFWFINLGKYKFIGGYLPLIELTCMLC